jgi:cell division protein FtsZ
LVNIIGGSTLSLDEARKILEAINKRLNPQAKLIWGAQISEDMENTIRVMLIITGVRSPQIFTSENTKGKKKKEIGSELGIEFVDGE